VSRQRNKNYFCVNFISQQNAIPEPLNLF